MREAAASTGREARAEAPAPALPPVRKPATVRCLGPVDTGPLAAEVDRLPDHVWNLVDRKKRYRYWCFHHTRHFVLRFFPPRVDPRLARSEPGWRAWRRWLVPVLEGASAAYGFAAPAFPKVMLARLAAGHRIDLHVDDGPMNPLLHKVHVPLRTDPEAVLIVSGTRHHLAPGFAWEVNNLAPHGAFNGGARDRIHLIFEVFEGAGHRVHEDPAGGSAGGWRA